MKRLAFHHASRCCRGGGAFTLTGLAILPRSRLSGATTRPTSQTSTTASLPCEDFAGAGATGAFDIPPVATQTGSVHVIVPAGVTVAPRRILSGLGERRLRRLGALIPTTRCPTRSL